MFHLHGGNPYTLASRIGAPINSFLDASASLVPMRPLATYLPYVAERFRYPDPAATDFRNSLSSLHHLPPDYFMVGNGAAELLTYAARNASEVGTSILLSPSFLDYERALKSCNADHSYLPLKLCFSCSSQSFPGPLSGDVIWVNNPHNPTGQLWDIKSLQPLLDQYKLVIVDEAFLPLVCGGDSESLLPLVPFFPNLIVIRSLTKLFGIAGVRLGYAVAQPNRLQRWSSWRDPWSVNSVALAIGHRLTRDPRFYGRWCSAVHRWIAKESSWLQSRISSIPGIRFHPSSSNFCLLSGVDGHRSRSLVPLRESLETQHRILLRDCRSFPGLGDSWLRLGYQSRGGNRRIVRAMRSVLLS